MGSQISYHNQNSIACKALQIILSFYTTSFTGYNNLLCVLMQVSSATATFAMTFSASMSVIEYYLLKRFPVPYGIRTSPLILLSCFTWSNTENSHPWLEKYSISHLFPQTKHAYNSHLNWFTALYFVAVATLAAFIGQHAVRKLINILGRASIIIFILALTIFVSAISLGMRKHSTFSYLFNHLSVVYHLASFF